MIHYCNARKKRCAKCGHRFTRNEFTLWECPECGADRHCHVRVKAEGLRCRLHGGASLSGAASPLYKTGRYSKFLPPMLAERYQEALNDQNLLALRDDIALLDTRINDLVSSIEVGSTNELWKSLREIHTNLKDAVANADADSISDEMKDLNTIISYGQDEAKTWGEIYTLLEQRRKLVESERKRLVEMHQVVTVEQLMILLSRVQEAIVNNVNDRSSLTAITEELRGLVLTPSS